MKTLILFYLFSLSLCYGQTSETQEERAARYKAEKASRLIERKKRDEEYEAKKELRNKKREEYDKSRLALVIESKYQKELRAENDLKTEREFERIRAMYSNDLNKSKISRLSVTTRLILGIKTGLSIYKMSWDIGGKKSVLEFIETQKKNNSTTGTYNYSFGRMSGDESCQTLLKINDKSGLSSEQTLGLASKFSCELSDKKIKVYAFAKFAENNKFDIWSIDGNGSFEHIQDGFDAGL